MRLLLLMTYLANTVWGQMYVRTDTTFIPLSTLDVDLIQCSRSCEKDPDCVGFSVDASRCTNLAPGANHPSDVVAFRKAGSLGSCPAGTKRWQKVFGTDTKGPKADQSSSTGTMAFTTQGNGVDSGAKTAPSTTTGAPSTATTTSGSGPRGSSEAISGARSSDSTIMSVQPASYPVDNGIPSAGTTDGNGVKIRSFGGTSSPFPTITSTIMTSSSSKSSTTANLTPGMVSLGDILSSTMTTSRGTDGGEVTEAASGTGSTTTMRTATATATGATSVLPTTTSGPTTVDSTTPKVLTTTTRATTKPGAHSPTTTGQTTGTVSLPTIAPTTPASSESSAVPDSTPSQTTMTDANDSATTNGTDETTMDPCVPCPKKGRGVRLYVPTSMMISPYTCNYCPVAH